MSSSVVTSRRKVLRTYKGFSNQYPPGGFSEFNSFPSWSWDDSVDKGDNLADWKTRIASGLDATTTLVGQKQKIRIRKSGIAYASISMDPSWNYPGNVYDEYHMGVLPWTDIGFSSATPSTLSDVSANNMALTKFIRKARQVNTAFQGGIFLGELAKTLHGIMNPAQALRTQINTYFREAQRLRQLSDSARQAWLRGRSIGRNLTWLPQLWLETQYHWRPLISDIDNGLEAVNRLAADELPSWKRISATGKSDEATTEFRGKYQSGLIVYNVHRKSVSTVKVVYRGAIDVRPLNLATTRRDLLGFNLSDFAPTMWEIMPYSFLIDYFTNIGDIINGWSFLRSSVRWSNRTVRREIVDSAFTTPPTKGEIPSVPWGTWRYYHFRPCQIDWSKTHVVRASYNGTYVPTFELQLPGLGTKWINISALIGMRGLNRFL